MASLGSGATTLGGGRGTAISGGGTQDKGCGTPFRPVLLNLINVSFLFRYFHCAFITCLKRFVLMISSTATMGSQSTVGHFHLFPGFLYWLQPSLAENISHQDNCITNYKRLSANDKRLSSTNRNMLLLGEIKLEKYQILPFFST